MENGVVSWTTVHCLLPPFHPLAANTYVSSLKASVTEHLGGRPLPPPGLSLALWVCLALRCGGFLSKIQYFLSTNHTSKSYKNMLFTQKNTSYLPFKHPHRKDGQRQPRAGERRGQKRGEQKKPRERERESAKNTNQRKEKQGELEQR